MLPLASEKPVGVIVARFHVPDLHEGHRYTIDYVLQRHKEVLVILGVPYESTDQNPLSFEMRKEMLESCYPGKLTIIGSQALPSSYERRSRKIDGLIFTTFPHRNAILYGARDSFVHTYKGVFSTYEVPTVYSGSGTKIRKSIEAINSSDFRAGVIHNAVHQKHRGLPTVDVAVVDRENHRVLLVGKNDEEGKLRFPGVFFDPSIDASFEEAAVRCILKELPSIRTFDPEIIKSQRIDDWRFRKAGSKVITLLMRARYLGGEVTLGKGVDTVRWVRFSDVPDVIIDSHQPLAAIMKCRW